MTEWTIQALLDWTKKYFATKGIETPRQESEILLAHALGCPRIELYTRFDEVVGEGPRSRFRELVRRRAEGCPVAYLVGYREFYKLPFRVSPAVLIPRPETEHLVELALRLAANYSQLRVLDLCTGSGCIAVSVAYYCKSAQVVATDVSADAVEVARTNAAQHGVAQRIEFRTGDLFSPIQPDERFDLILSNPPYVAHEDLPQLHRQIRDYEPRLALDGGAGGLTFYQRIAQQVSEFLAPGARLLLEIGYDQEEAVTALLAAVPGLSVEETVRDLARLPRIVVARRVA
jgi:release factor glutamine methyltransferase